MGQALVQRTGFINEGGEAACSVLVACHLHFITAVSQDGAACFTCMAVQAPTGTMPALKCVLADGQTLELCAVLPTNLG
jgi:hypothetical protein